MTLPCILCGQFSATEKNPLIICPRLQKGGNPCPTCHQLTEIEQRVIEAQQVLERVLEERRSLRARANQAHDPFIHQFPLEISYRIFELCLIPIKTLDDFADASSLVFDGGWVHNIGPQMIIGAVCQGWRHLLWSNPSLWNSISLRLSISTSPSFIPLLQDWLERSGHLALVVGLFFDSGRDIPADPVVLSILMEPLFETLNSFAHRFSLFRASIPTPYLQRLRCRSSETSILQGLIVGPAELDPEVAMGMTSNGVFDLGVDVSPTRLSVGRHHIENIHVKWSNLTHFTGLLLSGSEIIEVFLQTPQLAYCDVRGIKDVDRDLQIDSVILPSLTHLAYQFSSSELLNCLTCPSLKHLDCWLPSERFSNGLTPFIARSRCPLKVAKLAQVYGEDDEIIQFLQHTTYLQRLEVSNSNIGETFFNHLGETAFLDNQQTPFLPNLKFSSFETRHTFPWSTIPALRPTRTSTHQSCRPLDTIAFQLIRDFDGDAYDPPNDIDRASLEKILEIRSHGVDISVIDDRGTDLIVSAINVYQLS